MVVATWMANLHKPLRLRDPIDLWNHLSSSLRQHLKGWGANLGREARVEKESLLSQVCALDLSADTQGLDEDIT